MLSGAGGFKPSHVICQINVGDARSGFYWEGPTYGTESGFSAHELYEIVVWKLMPDMQILATKFGINWKVKVLVTDCGAGNPGFAKKCMGLRRGQALKREKTLRFRSPFADYDTFIIWCADHVAKTTSCRTRTVFPTPCVAVPDRILKAARIPTPYPSQ